MGMVVCGTRRRVCLSGVEMHLRRRFARERCEAGEAVNGRVVNRSRGVERQCDGVALGKS
jgi:hypothetical protein